MRMNVYVKSKNIVSRDYKPSLIQIREELREFGVVKNFSDSICSPASNH